MKCRMKRFKYSLIAFCVILAISAVAHLIQPKQPPIIDLKDVPEFNGTPYVQINNNVPYFAEEDMSVQSFESYAELDSLGRCGEAFACIGTDLMPTEERGSIGQVKPSGWQIEKYDFVDGKYLYNRCHLIAFQLAGENANRKNLITGTRFLNTEGMLPFENMVADYVKETGNHVLYRVTPIFQENELVARGVLIEAKSVEDNGRGILFCVYVYNNQPGVEIDYQTGKSKLTSNPKTTIRQDGPPTARGHGAGGILPNTGYCSLYNAFRGCYYKSASVYPTKGMIL